MLQWSSQGGAVGFHCREMHAVLGATSRAWKITIRIKKQSILDWLIGWLIDWLIGWWSWSWGPFSIWKLGLVHKHFGARADMFSPQSKIHDFGFPLIDVSVWCIEKLLCQALGGEACSRSLLTPFGGSRFIFPSIITSVDVCILCMPAWMHTMHRTQA